MSVEEEPDIYGPERDSDAFTEWDAIESKTSADNRFKSDEEQDDVAEEGESAVEASAAELALAMEVDSAEIGFGGIDDEDADAAMRAQEGEGGVEDSDADSLQPKMDDIDQDLAPACPM